MDEEGQDRNQERGINDDERLLLCATCSVTLKGQEEVTKHMRMVRTGGGRVGRDEIKYKSVHL